VLERIPRGQHQHRRLPTRFLAQLAAHLEPVHAGQVEVEHDDVEVVDHGEMQAGDAVPGEIDDVVAVGEEVADIGRDIAVVFNDEYAHRTRSPGRSRPWSWEGKCIENHRTAMRNGGNRAGGHGAIREHGSSMGCRREGRSTGFGTASLPQGKGPREVSLGNTPRLGPIAPAPSTVICQSPDLTLGVSSRLQCGDYRWGDLKTPLSATEQAVNRREKPVPCLGRAL